MSGDAKRSILGELKRPLFEPTASVSAALEEKLLGTAPKPQPPPAAEPPSAPARPPRGKTPTVPVTFHLPVALRDRVKITAQAQQRTMVEIACEALERYLEENPVSENDLRRLLGL
jgi:hypothetical protein